MRTPSGLPRYCCGLANWVPRWAASEGMVSPSTHRPIVTLPVAAGDPSKSKTARCKVGRADSNSAHPLLRAFCTPSLCALSDLPLAPARSCLPRTRALCSRTGQNVPEPVRALPRTHATARASSLTACISTAHALRGARQSTVW